MNVQYPKYPKYNKSVQTMYLVHSSKSSQQHKLYYIPKQVILYSKTATQVILYSKTIALLIASEYKVHLWSDVHSLYTFTDFSGIVQNQLKKA